MTPIQSNPETPNQSLDTLCSQLQQLREEKATLEASISALSATIIQKVGIDAQADTALYHITTKRVERIIFDRERFNEVFNPELFAKVSKPSFANMIYLSKPKETL